MYDSKKPRFIKNQEVSGLLNKLGTSNTLKDISILGGIANKFCWLEISSCLKCI